MDDALEVEVEQLDAARAIVAFKGEHDLAQVVLLGDRLSALVSENELVVADFSEAESSTRRSSTSWWRPGARPKRGSAASVSRWGRSASRIGSSRSPESFHSSNARPPGKVGVGGQVRDAAVIATHEAVASAMMSPGDVFVDASHDGDAVTVVVTSADGWTSPDDDLGRRRMSIVREIVENVSFEKGSGQPRLRFQKSL